MNNVESLRHTRWEHKYHIVFIPKRRKRMIYAQLSKELGAIFRELVQHREGKVDEGHLMGDLVHMLASIPPKYSVSQVVGTSKGRAQSTSRGPTGESDRILLGGTLGREDTMFRL